MEDSQEPWIDSDGLAISRQIRGRVLPEMMLACQFDAGVRQTLFPTGLRVDIDAAFGA
ncbi:hypothetical protein [Methylobacterium radiotolerans]|uniref:hypothetical protein n=1 Tax=Methylobacterium radiotolerans TaxID=31998 RepID=UPI0038CF8D36